MVIWLSKLRGGRITIVIFAIGIGLACVFTRVVGLRGDFLDWLNHFGGSYVGRVVHGKFDRIGQRSEYSTGDRDNALFPARQGTVLRARRRCGVRVLAGDDSSAVGSVCVGVTPPGVRQAIERAAIVTEFRSTRRVPKVTSLLYFGVIHPWHSRKSVRSDARDDCPERIAIARGRVDSDPS